MEQRLQALRPAPGLVGLEKGVWKMLMDRLSGDGNLGWLVLHSTVVRANACAAGAKK